MAGISQDSFVLGLTATDGTRIEYPCKGAITIQKLNEMFDNIGKGHWEKFDTNELAKEQ